MGTTASTVEDHYHLQKVKLGEGSFGVVWRAVQKGTGEPVAMKQMSKAAMTKKGIWRGDVDREISMMTRLEHDNIVKLYEDFEDTGYVYLALEFCDDGDFGDKVVERGSRMSEQEVAFWVRQILAPIAYMHSLRICHRDVKPDNFLVKSNSALKLADLGLAVECPFRGSLRERCGTAAFMAPELCRGSGYGLEVDLWAAGICMYMAMLGGRHPFLDVQGNVDERRALVGELNFYKVGILGGLGDGNFSFRPRPHDSAEAQRLCRAMVEVDVRRRMTAADACAEPWFEQGLKWQNSRPARPSRSGSKELTPRPAGISRSGSKGMAPRTVSKSSDEELSLPRLLGGIGEVSRSRSLVMKL